MKYEKLGNSNQNKDRLYNDWVMFLLYLLFDYPNLTSLLTLELVHVEWQVTCFNTE